MPKITIPCFKKLKGKEFTLEEIFALHAENFCMRMERALRVKIKGAECSEPEFKADSSSFRFNVFAKGSQAMVVVDNTITITIAGQIGKNLTPKKAIIFLEKAFKSK